MAAPIPQRRWTPLVALLLAAIEGSPCRAAEAGSSAALAPRSATAGATETPDTHFRLFFVTDRSPTGRAEAGRAFGDGWSGLSFGSCDVLVPPRAGQSRGERRERPFRTPGRPSKRVRLLTTTPMPRDSFFVALEAERAPGDSNGALVFLHGYNAPFGTSARFAAQLARAIRFSGPVILYSWPATPTYPADEEATEWTRPHLVEVLTDLRRSSAGPVHLLAYSMGANALVVALEVMAAEPADAQDPPLGEVVFAAPDVESRLFSRHLERSVGVARRVTLYASSRDRALRLSRRLHRHPRAGEAGRSLLLLPSLDTIDVSRINADILGHGYLDELTGDLHAVLVEHRPVSERPGMARVEDARGGHWRLARPR